MPPVFSVRVIVNEDCLVVRVRNLNFADVASYGHKCSFRLSAARQNRSLAANSSIVLASEASDRSTVSNSTRVIETFVPVAGVKVLAFKRLELGWDSSRVDQTRDLFTVKNRAGLVPTARSRIITRRPTHLPTKPRSGEDREASDQLLRARFFNSLN